MEGPHGTLQGYARLQLFNGIARFTIGISGPVSDYNETMIAFINGTTKGLDPG